MVCAMPGAERGEYLEALRGDALQGTRIGVVEDFPETMRKCAP